MLLGMLPKEKISGMLKEHIPTLLTAVMDAVRVQAGAPPEQRTGVLFFPAETPNGPTTMATVYALDTMDQPGETIGTIDLVDSFRKLDLIALFDQLKLA